MLLLDVTFISRFRPRPNSFRSVAYRQALTQADNFDGSTTTNGWPNEDAHNFPMTLRTWNSHMSVAIANMNAQGQTCAFSNRRKWTEKRTLHRWCLWCNLTWFLKQYAWLRMIFSLKSLEKIKKTRECCDDKCFNASMMQHMITYCPNDLTDFKTKKMWNFSLERWVSSHH